jgi:hypothetical protein
VYFLYPETCGVRLEDMDALFGDSTRALGTPASSTPALHAESDALLRPASPMPPLLGGSARHPASAAIPGLDIDPPDDVEESSRKPREGKNSSGGRGAGGIGGWFSRVMGRRGGERSGEYAPVDQRGD